MAAILLAKQDLKGCELYVYRETKDGTKALSRPCQYCWELISQVAIKDVHFTVHNGTQTETANA